MTDLEALEQPADWQVWAAMEAGQAEAATWRIIEFNGRGAIAVNDRRPLPDYTLGSGSEECTETFERHDFKDAAVARKYVEWRSIKAAICAYQATLRNER